MAIREKYKKKRHVLVAVILFDAFIVVLLVIYFGVWQPHDAIKINGTYLKTPFEIADLQFEDNHGKAFSKINLKGHWSMLFFGFTHCAMVCPTTMSELNSMYKILQQKLPEHQLPHVIFISVDPDQDTVEKLNRFVSAFNSHFVGLRADMPNTIALEKQLHIAVSKIPGNHSTEILLLTPAAKVQAYFPYPHQAEQMAKDYQSILDAA